MSYEKFKLKPKLIKFDVLGEEQEAYIKTPSYNLVRWLASNVDTDQTIQTLMVIKFCLCNEDGTMVIHEDSDLSCVGDIFPAEFILPLGEAILREWDLSTRNENVKKKQGN
ncbi:hypothetical protein MXM19_08410 [Aeromonas caviae]|uniref:hypothetical protein n=1 Tax=Aeromonas caviae TaxID=648 RepID=UPI002DBF69A7|nr:hypothetical protein [Aeromonas caviae]MEB6640868.1 hypothetical protein [Aeromonas caviae]